MMRSPLASRTLAFAFALALAACGGGASGTGGGGGSGGAPSCAQVADCPQPENDCQLATCNGGTCGLGAKPEGAICAQGAGTCDGNGQCNLCEPGFATCNGSTLLVCDESGTFDDPITCSGDTPYCDPTDPKCVGCFDTSQCVTPGMNPCLAVACLENACVTTLVPDGSACVANGETGVCADGMCLQCAPGEQTCSGDSLLTCGPDGMFDAAPCGGATPFCDPAALACVECLAASDCGAVGDPCGTPACLSGACSTTNQPNGTPCALGADAGTCSAGSCQVCTSGEKRCQAGGPQTCIAGQWVDQAACSGDQVCSGGACQAFVDMVVIPAGSFSMGCTASQSGCQGDELPVMPVTLTRNLWLSKTEITQAQYQQIMGINPAADVACGPTCPVEQVTWHMAAAFANVLSSAGGLELCYACLGAGPSVQCVQNVDPYGCAGYRLPTEAEWEAAARCGADLTFAGSNVASDVAWSLPNSGMTAHPVASKLPNACGLHDMSGNVWEWVHDYYSPSQYSNVPQTDPLGPPAGTTRVLRGGAYTHAITQARVAHRNGSNLPGVVFSNVGFRLARTAP
jgi:sulfatase modifying factor 1